MTFFFLTATNKNSIPKGIEMDATTLRKAADTIRILSAEAIQKAKSGHPGMPMGWWRSWMPIRQDSCVTNAV